jgi:hypothetical protein
MQRRQFIKMVAAGIGSAFLTNCGSRSGDGNGNGALPVPNGYEFYPVMKTGDALPTGQTASELSPALMINDHSEIIVHCQDSAGAHGVYEYTIDYAGAKPVVAKKRKILRQGDILQDGFETAAFQIGSTNKNGNYAVSVVGAQYRMPAIYMERDKGGLGLVVNPDDDLPGNAGKFAASFGDLELDDTNSIILTSHYNPQGENAPKEGVFLLCGGMVTDAGRLLLSSGDLLAGAGTSVSRIGLIDINSEGGEYVAQITCGIPRNMQLKAMASGGNIPRQTAVVSGNVNQPERRGLRSASRSLSLSRAASLDAVRGDVIYGPRVGGVSKRVAQIVHSGDASMTLYLDNKRVLGTGDQTPMENTVVNFFGPIIGRDGLLYFCAMTNHGTELCVYDGASVHTIITFGQTIETGGERIVSIDFGSVRNMVDSAGRLVFLAAFESGKKSAVLGIPV